MNRKVSYAFSREVSSLNTIYVSEHQQSIVHVVKPNPIPKNFDKLPSFNLPAALLCHNQKSHSLHLVFAFVQDPTTTSNRSKLLDEPLF